MRKTLLVDANNLLHIGQHGVKEFFHKGEHVGGIFHFLNTLRKLIEEYNFDKVLVMWDGDHNSSVRKLIYPKYKLNRRERDDEFKKDSFYKQKERIKLYLEECFVRQIEVEENEADDLMSYYCKISLDEHKTILTTDKDLTQLISDSVSIYSPISKNTYKNGDKIKFYNYEIPHHNVKTFKIISGDKSDNIDGIYFLGEKTFIKFFPEILENKITFKDILTKAEKLLQEDKDNSVLKNLLSGKTKDGIFGDEFFEINEKIIDLENPLITDEAKQIVEQYYSETLDPEGRGYKNLMKLMIEDGFFKFLPKQDDAWVDFIKPFMKLTRKEKKLFKNKKNN